MVNSKSYSAEQRVYFDLKNLFDEEVFSTVREFEWTKAETIDHIRALGFHYEKQFYQSTGISMDNFIKKNPSYQSFSSMAGYVIGEDQQDSKKKEKKKSKTQEDKLALRIRTGLVSENKFEFGLQELAQKRIITEILNFDYRTLWIGDVIAWAIVNEHGIRNSKEKKEYSFSPEELKKMAKHIAAIKTQYPELYNSNVPRVGLQSYDFRDKTGRKKWTNAEIHEAIKKFIQLTIERKSPKKLSPDGKTYYQVGVIEATNICKVVYRKTGKVSRRGKKPEYTYIFIFDTPNSLDFFNSVRNGFFNLKPQSYFKLLPSAQMIFRGISWKMNINKPVRLELNTLCNLAYFKIKHKTRKQKFIEQNLDKLKELGFISDWKKWQGKINKREVWYEISKTKQLPV